MTFEEMERTMQFILEQQAQLTVKQAVAEDRSARLEEAQAAAERQIERLGERMEQLSAQTAEKIERLGERMEQLSADTDARIENLAANTARQIDHLGAALVELTEAHARTETTVARLTEAQANSDRKFDALIDFLRGLKDGGS